MRTIITALFLIGIFAGCKSVQPMMQHEVLDVRHEILDFAYELADIRRQFVDMEDEFEDVQYEFVEPVAQYENVDVEDEDVDILSELEELLRELEEMDDKDIEQYEFPDVQLYFPTYDEEQIIYEIDESTEWKAPLSPNDSLSPFINKWYSNHLLSLSEPILYNITNRTTNVLRFTLLGIWSNPVSYRIEKDNSGTYITYNKTDGQGGYKVGKRIEHETKEINIEKWNSIIVKMDSINFWNINTHDDNFIFDGAEWIFEAFINGRYHFVTRTSPDIYDGEEYADLCNLIVKIYKYD
jgi:hypothetical protein